MADLTPWGEPYADLAAEVIRDKSAPPVLALAAFMFRIGAEADLRSLIDDAVALTGLYVIARVCGHASRISETGCPAGMEWCEVCSRYVGVTVTRTEGT
jgi:hypothetical protein